jgi:acyl carrier protein
MDVMGGSDQARARLRAVFERFVADPAELEAVLGGAPIVETLSIDSIRLVSLIAAIEKEFSVRFDYLSMDEAFARFESLLAFVTRPADGLTG